MDNKDKVNLAEPSQLHVDAVLTSYSQKYNNEAFIAEDSLPTAKVVKRSDVYFKYDKDQRFTIPNTLLGPKSRAGEVDLKVSTDNYSVEDHGLEEFVSQAEMDNADDPLDPQRDAVDLLMELLLLGHEKRVADIVFAAATYPTGNKTTLTGTNQWTDTTNSKPITQIMTGLDAAFLRPNVIIFGADSWLTFRTHPQVLDAVKGATRNQGAKGGVASREDVAALFEVDKVIVGRSRYNGAKPGQSASYSRLWADNCAMLHLKPSPTPRSVSFGCSFSETLPTVYVRRDDSRGIKGGMSVKAVLNESLKIKASDLGYLISDTNA